ncbi:MAG TPA: cation-transporting P-type ATPase [Sulfuriferula sp.]|nr:cation-transporting P-type ATPase [Sulfuriferula sp.]
MKIHHLEAQAALASLNTSADGLSAAEVVRRFAEFGPNRVEKVAGVPLPLRLLREFTHLFAVILWVAAGLAFVADLADPGKGMGTLGFAILGVILVNGLFSFWQEYRAERALAALEKLLPPKARAMRAGQVEEIVAAELVPGDIVLLGEGDDIPADCRLIEAFGVRVNTATITGESMPQGRDAQPSLVDEVLHSRNVLLAGTSMVAGEARAVVFATGDHTEFGKIAHLTQVARAPMSPLQREIARLSRLVALLATGLGVIFFFIGQTLGLGFWENFLFAIGIIVANVPEGLLPTVTLSLAMATQRMARCNALVRHLPAVETLGAASVILTDKTGTLTSNRMQVKSLFLGGEYATPQAFAASAGLRRDYRRLLETALLCHDLKATGADAWLGDPMEIALVRMAQAAVPDFRALPRVDELPFDTDRKRLSILQRMQDGLVLYTKGAPETVLPLCSQVATGGALCPLTPELLALFQRAQEDMTEQGLRVLAFAHQEVAPGYQRENLERDMVLTALVGLADPPRPEVAGAVQKCFDAGIRVIMVTGDHPRTALAIGREVGLIRTDQAVVVNGEQLARMSNTQLQLALDAPEILFARVGADQKLRIVTALKRKRHIVAVTGDGVNDAPALKHADIGIAMGLSGTDVAKEAADIILLDDNFASIVAAVEEGRAVFDNIRKFLTYILTSNIPELVPYLAFVLLRIPLPLTIIQILAVDLGTDMLPALGLGAEKPDPGVMKRPPRPRRERLITWPLLARAYLFLGVLEAAAAMAAFFFVLKGSGWHYGEMLGHADPRYRAATAATLSAIIAAQMVNVFLCRSPQRSVLTTGLRGNRLILIGIAAEILLILAIDYTALGNRIFGTAPIGWEVWLFVLPFAAGMLVLEEARKWALRRWIG